MESDNEISSSNKVTKKIVENQTESNNSDSESSDGVDEDVVNGDDDKLDKIVCPPLNENLISKLNQIFKEINSVDDNVDTKKMSLGIIKFSYNGKNYIHCPIKHVKKKGKDVCFGVCSHSNSLLDTAINRRKLSAHKFQYHYYGQAPDSNSVNIYLKTSVSVEEAINKMEKDKLKKNVPKVIKGFQCIHCLKMNPLINKRKRKL
jgi:hypothetical protein